MQRQGRKGSAHYRIVVQDSRTSPTSGRVIAALGSYDPHTKAVALKKEDAQRFLDNGAQPSGRIILILQQEGVKLPSWVVTPASDKAKKLRNAEKLRRNKVAEPEVKETESVEEVSAEEAVETPPVEVAEEVAEAAPVEETPTETSAE